jgi:hypothetical protein
MLLGMQQTRPYTSTLKVSDHPYLSRELLFDGYSKAIISLDSMVAKPLIIKRQDSQKYESIFHTTAGRWSRLPFRRLRQGIEVGPSETRS